MRGIPRTPDILQQRLRDTGVGQFRNRRPAEPRAIAGKVDAQHQCAPGGIAARHPVMLQCVEVEGNIGKVGKLRLRLRSPAHAGRVAWRGMLRTTRIAVTPTSPSIASGIAPSTTATRSARSHAV